MKIKVNTHIFKDAMEKVLKVTAKKSSVPILENVLIQPSGGDLYLSATNLEQSVKIRISAETTDDIGFAFSDTKSLLKAMKFFFDDFITLEYGERETELNGNKAKVGEITISCGGRKAKQEVYSADEFPLFPKLEGDLTNDLTYNNSKLKERFNSVKYAVSGDTNRPAYCGIYFRETDMAATDTHRFALNIDLAFSVAESFSVPCKAINLVNEILGESLLIKTTKKYIQFSDREDNITVISRLCEGVYADYPRYIRNRGCREVTVNAENFSSGVKYLKIFAPSKEKFDIAWFKDKLGFKTAGGYHESEVDVDGDMDIELQFNGSYMLDALAQFKRNIIINTGNSMSQIIITSEADPNNTAIVSPVRPVTKLFER